MKETKRARIIKEFPKESLVTIFSYISSVYRNGKETQKVKANSSHIESDSLPQIIQDEDEDNQNGLDFASLQAVKELQSVSKAFKEEMNNFLKNEFLVSPSNKPLFTNSSFNGVLNQNLVNELIDKWNYHYSLELKLQEVQIHSNLLTKICSECINLFNLNLFACTINDINLIQVDKFSTLRRISISSMSNIQLNLLGQQIEILQFENINFSNSLKLECPNIKEISFSNCDIKDEGIISLVNQLKNSIHFEKLILNECNRLINPHIKNPFLSYLSLNRNNSLKNPFIECENLNHLEMKWCDELLSFYVGSNILKLFDVTGSFRNAILSTSFENVTKKINSSINDMYGNSCEVKFNL